MSEREISGKVRHFQFGTYTFKIIRQQTGTQTIQDVFARLANKRNTGRKDDNGQEITEPVMSQLEHVDFIVQFFLSCAKHAAMSLNLEVDFNEVNVSDWVDAMGYEQSMALLTELIECYAENEKNHKAPVMGQLA